MKIFVYYQTTNKPWGGSNSFIKAFIGYLKKRKDVQIATDINEDYEIFFMNGCSKSASGGKRTPIDLKEVKKIKGGWFKKSDKKIVYRLDGLRAIYANKSDLMDNLQIRALNFADHVIFQSKHCMESFKRFGYFRDNYSIIKNGVDQTIFNTKNKRFWNKKDKLKIFSTSWSTNPLKRHQIVAAFSENPNVESYFVGNWPKRVDKKKVRCLPPMRQENLASHGKKCDIFLHPAKNDPCPNVVLEALSCGLPVIYDNSGGTPELSTGYGLPLPDLINPETIQVVLEKIKKNYEVLVKRIIDDKLKFSIDHVGGKYINVFSRISGN